MRSAFGTTSLLLNGREEGISEQILGRIAYTPQSRSEGLANIFSYATYIFSPCSLDPRLRWCLLYLSSH